MVARSFRAALAAVTRGDGLLGAHAHASQCGTARSSGTAEAAPPGSGRIAATPLVAVPGDGQRQEADHGVRDADVAAESVPAGGTVVVLTASALASRATAADREADLRAAGDGDEARHCGGAAAFTAPAAAQVPVVVAPTPAAACSAQRRDADLADALRHGEGVVAG
ncbi:hypothetical protein [Streptomyces sp. NPDC015125]|uniref:hypothetical protein n=1 Tax=Streptomyces sp. NPDC015125 TaxID=3364938 RepID=UPI0036F6BCBE